GVMCANSATAYLSQPGRILLGKCVCRCFGCCSPLTTCTRKRQRQQQRGTDAHWAGSHVHRHGSLCLLLLVSRKPITSFIGEQQTWGAVGDVYNCRDFEGFLRAVKL